MAESDNTTIWHPADIFAETPKSDKGFALIVLNQPLENSIDFYTKVWSNATYHVGADGGANRVRHLNQCHKQDRDVLNLDTVIGDLDSLSANALDYWQKRGSEVVYDSDQYSTDFQKAVKYIRGFQITDTGRLISSKIKLRENEIQKIKDGPENNDIVCLGGLGGRVDQAISTLNHLFTFQEDADYASGKMFLLSTEAISFVLKSGKHKIKLKEQFPGMGLGRHVGILPLKEPSIISTEGLRWDVENWRTEFSGAMSTSNQIEQEWLKIETTKDVLFTIELDFS
jgi:thiamine pyrophosphokinase